MSRERWPLRAAVSIVLQAAALGAAYAQVGGTSPPALEEVVVTATRRATSTYDVPYNISAVSGAQLSRAGISDLASLAQAVPGLTFMDEGVRSSGAYNRFLIRGLNADIVSDIDDTPPPTEPTVSTYIGETPLFFPLKLVDIDHVEVLRGPQGTLYGSGSAGGTVRFLLNDANMDKTTLELNTQVSATEHAPNAGYEGYVVANLPLSEHLAFRGYVGYEYTSGFIEYIHPVVVTGGGRYGPHLSIGLANPADPINSPPAYAGPIKGANSGERTFARAEIKATPTDYLTVRLNYLYQDNMARARNSDNPFFGSGQNYINYSAFLEPQTLKLNSTSAEVEVDLGFASLTSSTSYSELVNDSLSDGTGYILQNLAQYYLGFPRLLVPTPDHASKRNVAQEVRITSKGQNKVDWLIGAYYLDATSRSEYWQYADGLGSYVQNLQHLGNFSPGDFIYNEKFNETFLDRAVFGELTWHVTPRFDLIGGARFFKEGSNGLSGAELPYLSKLTSFQTTGDGTNQTLFGAFQPTAFHASDHIFKFNGSYRITDEVSAYAVISQGFRRGGGNALPDFDQNGQDLRPYHTFRPDRIKNYEIGTKARFRNAEFTAALYDIHWEQMQVELFTSVGTSYVGNVPKAESRGLEFEGTLHLTERLSSALGYAYTDAKVKAPFELSAGNLASTVPEGASLPGAARNVVTFTTDFQQPLAGKTSLLWHVAGSYTSARLGGFNIPPVPGVIINNHVLDSYSLWHTSVAYQNDHWTASLFVDNVFDKRGETNVLGADVWGQQYQRWGVTRPRTVGIRVRYVL
jgi:iron complex outermembrane receptor protein